VNVPEFKIYTGPMFGGKTTRLLADLERYQYQNKKTILFKPSIDQRYSTGSVSTHKGQKVQSFSVVDGAQIAAKSFDFDIIAVDEMFMIPHSADALLELFSFGKTILVSTLQLTSHPYSLSEVSKIMPFATKIEICPAVCAKCEKDAYYTRRLAKGSGEVQLGGKESYQPLCFNHFTEIKNIKTYLN
jgi:thymidine kinase